MVDIEPIRTRAEAGFISARETLALIEEISTLRAALLEEQTVHAKTMDNFEAEAGSWLEERTRLLDRYARLEQELEHARAAKLAAVKHLTDQIVMQSTNPGGVDIGGAS